MRLFQLRQHYAQGQRFSYDLSEIGAYYRDYVTMMRHFDEVQPGSIHRVIHEELVEDPETEVRRLLDELLRRSTRSSLREPRARPTASSEQVRRPISREGLDQWNFAGLPFFRRRSGCCRIGTVSGRSHSFRLQHD